MLTSSNVFTSQIKRFWVSYTLKYQCLSMITKVKGGRVMLHFLKMVEGEDYKKPNDFSLKFFIKDFFGKCIQIQLVVRKCSVKKSVLQNFAKFTGKHLYQGLLFNTVVDLRPAALLKKDSGTRVFMRILRNFEEHFFYKTPPDDG